MGFPGGSDGRVCLQCGRPVFDPWIGKIPWRGKWQPTPIFLLENPMDRGACQATVHGVAESTQLSDFTFISFHTHHLRGTRTLLQGRTNVSWLFLPCFCTPSLISNYLNCPLELKGSPGGWMKLTLKARKWEGEGSTPFMPRSTRVLLHFKMGVQLPGKKTIIASEWNY